MDKERKARDSKTQRRSATVWITNFKDLEVFLLGCITLFSHKYYLSSAKLHSSKIYFIEQGLIKTFNGL